MAEARIPITSVADPATSLTAIVMTGTEPLQAFIVGGTVASQVSFLGTVTTDITDMKIKDAAGNLAVCPPANSGKLATTTALVVQVLDTAGNVLLQQTQADTLTASQAIQTNTSGANTRIDTANVTLTAIRDSGTLIHADVDTTAQNTTAQRVIGTAANALLSTINSSVAADAAASLAIQNNGTATNSKLDTANVTLTGIQSNTATIHADLTGIAASSTAIQTSGTTTNSSLASILAASLAIQNNGTGSNSRLDTTNSTLAVIQTTGVTGNTLMLSVRDTGTSGNVTLGQIQTNTSGANTRLDTANATLSSSYTAMAAIQLNGTGANTRLDTSNAALAVIQANTGSLAAIQTNTAYLPTILTNGSIGNTALAAIQSSSSATQTNTSGANTRLDTANTALAAIQNNGTTANASLTTLISSVLSGTLAEYVLLNAVSSPTTGPTVNVAGRGVYAVQHSISGTASVQVCSSLDASTWYVESVSTMSELLTFEGAAKYLCAVYTAGDGVVTTRLACR